MTETHYRVGDLAALTGVSIRTLRYYDQIRLLRPSARSDAGYRLYGEADLLRLQQILTLRYLGFPLRQIGALLDRPDFDLAASLSIQRRFIQDRIVELTRIDTVLDALLECRRVSGKWDWQLVAEAAAAAGHGLDEKGDKDMSEYYSPEEMQREFEALSRQVPAEEIKDVEEGWLALMRDIRAAHDLEPSSAEAKALAERWDRLYETVILGFRGNQKLIASVRENYRQGLYDGIEGAPTAEDFAFITRVKETQGA